MASDTLLLTQFVAPLGVALFITAPAPRWRSPRLRAFAATLALAYGPALLLRLGLQLAQWGNYPAVVRHAPTPPAVAKAAGRMLADLTGPIPAAVPAFVALLGIGVAGALWLARHQPLPMPPAQRQAGWFAAVSLASTLIMPVLSVYWQNPQHGRYLLPCLVMPLWWLATVLPAVSLRRLPLASDITVAMLLGVVLWQTPPVRLHAWQLPYPHRVEKLDKLLGSEGHTRGLADFWHAHYLSTISRSGLRLNQLRPDARVQFWGNNAFHHFEAAGPDGPLTAPHYTFIIVNGLDTGALRRKFGEPARIAETGDYTVYFYDETEARRLSALADAEVRTFLGNRPGTERIAR